MKRIELRKLELMNFKGIKEKKINFGTVTDIYGRNKTGKTTIFDSVLWLLFGKDSNNRSDFNVKTLDHNGEVIHGLEHQVIGTFDIGGQTVVLRRLLKENWVKKRGSADSVLSGNVTEYFVNEVPKKEKEYKDYIKTIVDEEVFKLISNLMYFNVNLEWKKKREILLNIVSDISDEDVMNSTTELQKLVSYLNGTNLDDFKAMIASQKKKLNEQLKAIPIRIDEINRKLPALAEGVDYESLENKKGEINGKLVVLESNLNNQKKVAQDMAIKQSVVLDKKYKLKDMEMQLEKDSLKALNDMKFKLMQLQYEVEQDNKSIDHRKSSIETIDKQIAELDKEADNLRKQYAEQFKAQFVEPDRDNFICPTCKQHLPEDDIEKQIKSMSKNFEIEKARALSQIQLLGKGKVDAKNKLFDEKVAVDEAIKEFEFRIANKNAEIFKLTAQIDEEQTKEHKVNYDSNEQYVTLKNEIASLEKSILPIDENNRVREQYDNLQNEIIDINNLLSSKKAISDAQVRIKELKADEKTLAQQVADIEQKEFLAEKFIRTKASMLEERINNTFKYVTFKLFDVQMNGGTSETCQALIEGVPFQDANNAAKYNAGIDVINALSKYYDVSGPVFIDNREGIIDLIDTDSQVINLIVSRDDKKLRIVA